LTSTAPGLSWTLAQSNVSEKGLRSGGSIKRRINYDLVLATKKGTAMPSFAKIKRIIAYGPTEPFFNATWKPGDIEAVK
jgi:hypothetical protein